MNILQWLFVVAVALKWAGVGEPATWSWWLLALAWLAAAIFVQFLRSLVAPQVEE